jgi:hypothetical protein
MQVLWYLATVAGLLLLVYMMIVGVPRPRASSGDRSQRAPRLLLPVVGTFSTAVGITGYLTESSPRISGPVRVAIIGGVGVAVSLLAAWTIVKAFAAPSDDPEDDPRYRFQGHIARVTEPILVDRPGRVVFEIDGSRYELRARSVNRAPVAADTEVVIEQIDDDLATVELWAAVEERL